MKTLIILHGWKSNSKRWQKVKQEIEKAGINVIVPDLPGFEYGRSLSVAWDLDNYVAWLKNFSFDKGRFYLLGHSFGGRIAIKYAREYGRDLEGLVLVSAAGIKRRNRLLRFFESALLISIVKKFSFLPGYESLRKLFYKGVLRKTDYVNVEGVLKETFKKIVKEDLTPLLSEIRVPTLIVWGDRDNMTPIGDGYLMVDKIPEAKIEVLKGISHTPHIEVPEILAKKIIDFIKPPEFKI